MKKKIAVYLVLNWSTPVGVFANSHMVVFCLRTLTKDWPKPLAPGCITVLRFFVSDRFTCEQPETWPNGQDVSREFLACV